MPMMTALKRFHYARRDIQPGETFEASAKDAKVFLALKRAKAAAGAEVKAGKPAPWPEEPKGYSSTKLPEDAAPMKLSDAPTASRRGRYARRDLRSE